MGRANVGKRLTKRPKLFLRDSGLLHQVLRIGDADTLQGHPVRCASWEGFVIEQIIALLPEWVPSFYRTSQGAEFDLVMENGGVRLAFEIKAASAPSLTKGFHTARADLQPEKTFVVSRATETWTNSHGVTFTSASALPEVLAGL